MCAYLVGDESEQRRHDKRDLSAEQRAAPYRYGETIYRWMNR